MNASKTNTLILSFDQHLKKNKTLLLVSNIFPSNSVSVNYGKCSNTCQRHQSIQSLKTLSSESAAAPSQHRATSVYLEVLGSSGSLFQLLWR